MRYSTTTGLVLAAFTIGDAMAGPTHAHLHRKAHEKKDIDIDWNNLGIDWSSAWAAGQKTAAPVVAAPTPIAAAPAAASTTAAPKGAVYKEKVPTSSNSLVDDLEDLWDGLVGYANSRSSFGESLVLGGGSAGGAGLAGDFENGNIGEPYASNMMKVDSTEGHDYTITFVNTQEKTISLNIWNKGGSDKQPLSGASLAPKDTALTFTLAPKAKQIVAFAERSYIAFAEPCKQRSFEGSFATTWGEVKFQNTGCGFDVSAIKNGNGNDYKMSMKSEENSCVSDQDQNMWLTPSHPVGGANGSCYVPGSKLHLTVEMGGRS